MSELKRIVGYIPLNEKIKLKSQALREGKKEKDLVSEFVLNNLKGESNGSQKESSSKESKGSVN